ncbi:MFS transporter [Microbacterium gorillae]|uniref:MFS transporter n=1 Tax=Microbacterium gorillae TaxID=1231063 RepID=UPI00058C3B31|nr:MFS transporter [Microbacterium gorillae]
MSTATVPVQPASETPPPAWRYLGLVLAPGIGSYAFNAVTVTLPAVRTDLGMSDAMLELVVAAYSVPFAVLLIIGGRLGDRFGRHRLFLIGMVAFLMGAIACSLAPSVETLLAARAAQGIGVALGSPQVLAVIQATSTGAARVRAISAFSASGGIGSALGQVIGGTLASASFGPIAGWRAVYWVAALLAGLAVVLSRFAPRSVVHEPVAIDVAGTVELAVGILLIISALTFGPALGWSWPIVLALLAGVGMLVILWQHQSRIERSGRIPLLPPQILRLRPLQLGLTAAGLFFIGFGAVLYVIPRALDDGLGMTPLESGLTMLPFAAVFTVISLRLSRIQRRLGDATLMWGVLIQTIALIGIALTVLLAWTPQLPWLLQLPLLLLGAGQAMIFSPLTQRVVREVPVHSAGLSGGLFGTAQQLSLSLGVILIGGIVASSGWVGQAELAAGVLLDLVAAVIVFVLSCLLLRRSE